MDDLVVEYLKKMGHLYTDKQLAEQIQEKFGLIYSDCQIRNIRHRIGKKKFAPALRKKFGGGEYPNGNKKYKYNFEKIIMVSEKIIEYFYKKKRKNIEEDDIIFVSPTKHLGVSPGICGNVMKYLKSKGIAECWSKNNRNRVIWKVNVFILKRELKNLKNNQ